MSTKDNRASNFSGSSNSNQDANQICTPTHLYIPSVGEMPVYRYVDVYKNLKIALPDPTSYYLYILRWPNIAKFDKSRLQPFYVGIGQERRYAFHYVEASGEKSYVRDMRNRHKFHTVRKIGRDEVLIQILPLDETEAKALEMDLIAHWGRRNQVDKPGILTNLTAGGEGVSGIPMPEHVAKKLVAAAQNPIKFHWKNYDGLKPAFEDYTPDELSEIFSAVLGRTIDASNGMCRCYRSFKTELYRWKRQCVFPEGFNYLGQEGEELHDELPLAEFAAHRERVQSENRAAGFAAAYDKKYSYPKYRTPWGDFKTLASAADFSPGSYTHENLIRKFQLMGQRNHFDPGFNILSKDGVPQHQEQEITLLEKGRSKAGQFIANYISVPMIVYGETAPSRTDAFNRYKEYKSDYPAFVQFVKRCIEFGAFPEGLNVTEAEGGPYPQISSMFVDHPLSDTYVKVCGRYFPSLQAASIALGRKNKNALWPVFEAFKKRWQKDQTPFPKGFNVYTTIGNEPLYPEQPQVCHHTPTSGVLYGGKRFANAKAASLATGRKATSVAVYLNKRRKAFLETGQGMEPGINVFGLDGNPLYPIAVSSTATEITTTTGKQIRSNSAKTVFVFIQGEWRTFTPIVSAWHKVGWIHEKYQTAEKFYAAIKRAEKNNTLDARIRLKAPMNA